MIRCIVFDLWNTLVHSRSGNPFQQAKALLRENQSGLYAEWVRDGMVRPYGSTDAFLEAWRDRLRWDPVQEEALKAAFRAADAEAQAFPETRTILERSRRLSRLALLSNTQTFDLGLLDRLGLAAFFHVKGFSAELGALKPEPAAYGALQKRLGLFPGNLVMVGDSWKDDVEGALAAGWTAIWVNRDRKPRPVHDPEAELVEVQDLAQVPLVVERLQSGMRCSTCLG